jgi:hypothetical protein
MAVSAEYIDQKDPEEDTLDWGEEVNVSGYTIKSNSPIAGLLFGY